MSNNKEKIFHIYQDGKNVKITRKELIKYVNKINGFNWK